MNDQATATNDQATTTATSEVRKAIDVLHQGVVELRVPSKSKKFGTLAGWFDDHDKLTEAINELNGKHASIYFTLNPTVQSLTARCHNKVQSFAPATTGDNDIVRRHWLLIDVDPVRPSGVSSSDAEKAAALTRTQEIHNYLREQGWPRPVSADSGNGFHLLYRIDLPNTKEVTEAVQDVLKHLADKFDNDFVKVDKTVFNAARITKAYGSIAAKGENMAERPHRVSQLRTVPDKIVPVTLAQLQALAKTTKPVKESSGLVIKNHNENVSKVDITAEKVTEFLDFYKLEHDDPTVRPNGAVMWRVIGCPFNSDHAECAVFLSDGSLGFNCFHNSNGCCDKHWKELRLHLEEVSGKKFYFQTNTDIKTATGVATSKLNVKAASAIKPEALEWLWKGQDSVRQVDVVRRKPRRRKRFGDDGHRCPGVDSTPVSRLSEPAPCDGLVDIQFRGRSE